VTPIGDIHTDDTGDKASNKALSLARATTVMAALVRNGIDKSRLSAEGYGEASPIADNATEQGRARNRRISMRITEK
jgi:K(+)-stimulated pyrophosphate-energized sodium pump